VPLTTKSFQFVLLFKDFTFSNTHKMHYRPLDELFTPHHASSLHSGHARARGSSLCRPDGVAVEKLRNNEAAIKIRA
jgi:hypothetical protein